MRRKELGLWPAENRREEPGGGLDGIELRLAKAVAGQRERGEWRKKREEKSLGDRKRSELIRMYAYVSEKERT